MPKPLIYREYNDNKELIRKKCSLCDNIKSIGDFTTDKNAFDGYSNRCKECQAKYKKEYRKNNPGKQ